MCQQGKDICDFGKSTQDHVADCKVGLDYLEPFCSLQGLLDGTMLIWLSQLASLSSTPVLFFTGLYVPGF